jgi:hypothetical protein
VRRLIVVAIVVLAGLSPGAASATGPGAYQAVLRVYELQGTVPACQFSAGELEQALKGVDTYGAQYFADFTQAIQSALSARAAGACAGAAPTTASATGTVAPQPAANFGPVTAATSSGIPAPLAVLGGLTLALAAFGLVRLVRK